MINFELIVIHVVIFQISHGLASSNQCCAGVVRLVNNSSDASTHQQVGFCRFDQPECASDLTSILICTLSPGVINNVSYYDWCGDVDIKQLQVEVCISNNWEKAPCNTSAACYDYLIQYQCTLGNLSVLPHSKNVTLTWSQPISNLSASCCPAPYCETNCFDKYQYHGESSTSVTLTGLKPYTVYKCCAWAIYEYGIQGRRSCQYVQTDEEAPGPPTNLTSYPIMTCGFLLTWKAPAVEVQNGVIRSYYIEINDSSGSLVHNITTEADDPYFLLDYDDLTEGHEYIIRVAANTTEQGEFSESMPIDFKLVPLLKEGDNMALLLSFTIGLLFLILIVVTIVAITICNRMRKQNKNLTREVQEYEMTSKYSATRHDSASLPERYSAIKKRDSNRKQPLYPPAQLVSDYLTPTATKTAGSMATEEEKKVDSEDKAKINKSKDSDENPYQSLILSQPTVTPDGYIKVVRTRLSSLEEETPQPPLVPPAPPKCEPKYSLKSSIPQLSLADNIPPRDENIFHGNRSGTL